MLRLYVRVYVGVCVKRREDRMRETFVREARQEEAARDRDISRIRGGNRYPDIYIERVVREKEKERASIAARGQAGRLLPPVVSFVPANFV